MVGAVLGKEGTKLLEDGLDEVRFECGHGACSFRSGSVENSPNDGASVPALHLDTLPIDGSSKRRPSDRHRRSLTGGHFWRVRTRLRTSTLLPGSAVARRCAIPGSVCTPRG